MNRMQIFVLFSAFIFSLYNVNGSTDPGEVNWVGRTTATSLISTPLSASQRTLTAVKVNPTGQVYSTQILKQQLANDLNLPLRDLRVVDPSFPNQIQATFTARPKAILFCIENIKVVV